jgi:hypothetical protein
VDTGAHFYYDPSGTKFSGDLEGTISGKKAVGRPRLQYLKQIARNTAADSCTAMKRMACNNSRWKAVNHSID